VAHSPLFRLFDHTRRIESRDFVTLDPEQARIKTELAIDNIEYHVMRAESYTRSETAFDLVEGTTALACASGKIHLVVQLKREIGKLWEDIAKAPIRSCSTNLSQECMYGGASEHND